MAVLLIDVINGFGFPGAGSLVRAASAAAPHIQHLSGEARKRGVPVIYVNDNFGRWRSDFAATVRECTKPTMPGRYVTNQLRPKASDYFVLKAQHSAFYSTPLDLLLQSLGVRTLILAGFAANRCVLFTANDAYIHGYHLAVPSDCTASNSASLTRGALTHMRIALAADTRRERRLDFSTLARHQKKSRGQAF